MENVLTAPISGGVIRALLGRQEERGDAAPPELKLGATSFEREQPLTERARHHSESVKVEMMRREIARLNVTSLARGLACSWCRTRVT